MQAPPGPFNPPPAYRSQDNFSPSSANGSDWSGMNNYNNGGLRPDFNRPPRGDSMSPSEGGDFDARPPVRAQTFASGPPVDGPDPNRGSSGAGSRASSRAASSRASDLSLRDPRSQRSQKAESELRQHYAVLRAYLKGGASQPPRTNKARDKLLRLSPVQFHELSTDVFDELQRRQAAQPLPGRPPRQDKVPPFLQPRSEFHEKRNQARQKLSSLQTSRFRDLSTDVFCELERRFPHFNPDNKRDSQRSMSRAGANGLRSPGMPPPNGYGPPNRAHTTHGSMSSNAGFPPRKQSMAPSETSTNGNELGRPMPKQFQSNTITPNKSTMVEDDDDDDDGPLGGYDRSSDAFGLESSLTSPRGSRRDTSATSNTGMSRSMYPPPDEMQQKISELEHTLTLKDEELKRLSSTVQVKDELQQKLDQAQSLNQSMKVELEKLRSGQSGEGGEWREKYQELEQQHQTLRTQLEKQTMVTDEVRKQFQSHVADMRAMADETASNIQREEQMHSELQRLREDASAWKARYTKIKTQAAGARQSIQLDAASTKVLRDQNFSSTDGLVTDVHVTQFQLSIDELLSTARSQESTATIEKTHDLVSAVRNITGDVERVTEGKNDETSRKYKKSLTKVSATANNVITAANNYAAAYGLSPVSLLDAAASHLTAAIVDLLRTAKIRSVAGNETARDGEQHMTPVNKNGYFEVNGHIRSASDANSLYSALSDPPENEAGTSVPPHAIEQSQGTINGLGFGINPALRQDDVELEELKIYIGNQTDLLVQHIQALVHSVRGDQPLSAVQSHTESILDTTDRILATAEGGFEQPTAFQTTFNNLALASFEALNKSRDSLERTMQDSTQHEGKPSARDFCQTLPPLSFQLARDAKDLASKIESVTITDEDFS